MDPGAKFQVQEVDKWEVGTVAEVEKDEETGDPGRSSSADDNRARTARSTISITNQLC